MSREPIVDGRHVGKGSVAELRPLGRGLRFASRTLTRVWSLPPERAAVRVKYGLRVPMSDGTELVADLYEPQTEPIATVLVRSPYGRATPENLLFAQVYAARGYQVLLQSCRGTFGSGGELEPFAAEIADGHDTVSWLRGQPWFTGRLVTAGGSYLGYVQWALAMDPPAELVATIMHCVPHDPARAIWRNGVLALADYLGWSEMMSQQESRGILARVLMVATGYRRIRRAGPVSLESLSKSTLKGRAPWFDRWRQHSDPTDEFWNPKRCGQALERLAVPTLLIAGWHDVFLDQMLDQYHALASRGRQVRLVVGPWHHTEMESSAIPMRESLDWLDLHVRGGARPSEPVTLHVGGAKRWRSFSQWPPPSQQQRWYLSPGMGLAADPLARDSDRADRFRFDPLDPTPSVGGAVLSLQAGPRDNRKIEQRNDVLVYTSAPLTNDLTVIGEVTTELSISRDNANADVFVRLCDVDGRGKSMNVCDTIVRLTDADPLSGALTIKLAAIAHQFRAGHRLRLQVAGGAYPRFARNPGNGTMDDWDPSRLRSTEYRVSVAGGSALLLPVVEHY